MKMTETIVVVALLAGCASIHWTNSPDDDLASTVVEVWRGEERVYVLDVTGHDTRPGAEVTIPVPASWTFEPGVTYRVRARHVDCSGNEGAWSEWSEFTAGTWRN